MGIISCVNSVKLKVADSMRSQLEFKESKMLCSCTCPSKLKLPMPRRMFRQPDPLMPISIYLVTWNVLSRPPEEDLKPLLGLDKVVNPNLLPDIYVVGLQEVKAMPYSILMDSIFEAPWVKSLRTVMAPYSYVKIRVIRLQGLLLAIFVKRHHLPYVQEVETEYTRTGLGRVWGNKGAVTVRMNAFNCSLCFVNSHLAAHDTELKRRIDDYNIIVDAQTFKYPETEKIFYHDYIFWLGDLNFRLHSKPVQEIVKAIADKNYGPLLAEDQLRMVQKTGQAFSELEENEINFAPTYKFVPGTMQYDTNRRPAWTDRILHKVNANVYENVTLDSTSLSYRSHEEYLQSDHKPVTALYNIRVFQSLPERFVQFAPISFWTAGKENRVVYFLKAGELSTVWDWIGLYKADFTNIDDYLAYTWVTGRGVPFMMPPTASGQASEHVIDSWQSSDLPPNIQFPPDSDEQIHWDTVGSPSACSAESLSPEYNSGMSTGRTRTPFTPPGSVDWDNSSFTLTSENQLKKRDYTQQKRPSRAQRRRSNGRDAMRPTPSHSPIRRLSEQLTSAVFRLANLFQAVPKTKYVVTFPEVLSVLPGQYCLLYVSHGVDSIHGMSDPFEMVNSELR